MALGQRMVADSFPLSSSGGGAPQPITSSTPTPVHCIPSSRSFVSCQENLNISTSATSSAASCLLGSHAASLVSLLSYIFQMPLYRTDTFLPPFPPACSGLLTYLPQPPSLCTVGPE